MYWIVQCSSGGRVQGVANPVAVAGDKGVEVTLGTGWPRRRQELNRLRLLWLLQASQGSAQHRDSRRRFVAERCAACTGDKEDSGQHCVLDCGFCGLSGPTT